MIQKGRLPNRQCVYELVVQTEGPSRNINLKVISLIYLLGDRNEEELAKKFGPFIPVSISLSLSLAEIVSVSITFALNISWSSAID